MMKLFDLFLLSTAFLSFLLNVFVLLLVDDNKLEELDTRDEVFEVVNDSPLGSLIVVVYVYIVCEYKRLYKNVGNGSGFFTNIYTLQL